MNLLNYINAGNGMGFIPYFLPAIVLFAVWTLFWKGIALWHSAKRGEKWWFIALLVINSLGILEIVYIFFIAKIKASELFGGTSR